MKGVVGIQSGYIGKRRNAMDVVTLENVTKSYSTAELVVPALKGINLSLEFGALISFVGPSGSGKTTLLNLIGCLDKPTDGRVTVAGEDVARLNRKSAARFRGMTIGFIFQSFNLLPVLTVFENVEYPLIMVRKEPAEKRRRKVFDLLERVGMADQVTKYPAQLSGGQKQRVAVARALVTEPKLVLADEPTANLDHATAFSVIGLMHEMREKFQTTFIFATHDEKVVSKADIIYSMEDGLIIDKRRNKADPRKGESAL
jgi:putative ABC transport system ATP-binding protein